MEVPSWLPLTQRNHLDVTLKVDEVSCWKLLLFIYFPKLNRIYFPAKHPAEVQEIICCYPKLLPFHTERTLEFKSFTTGRTRDQHQLHRK